jgi:hypothetical protein
LDCTTSVDAALKGLILRRIAENIRYSQTTLQKPVNGGKAHIQNSNRLALTAIATRGISRWI